MRPNLMRKILILISVFLLASLSFLLYKSYLRIQEQKYIVSIQNEINYYLLNADYNSAFNLLENTESEYQQELDNIIAAYARELCDASYDTLSTSELKNELLAVRDFEGVTGFTSFDKNGEVHKNLYLLRIKGDQFLELNSFDQIISMQSEN